MTETKVVDPREQNKTERSRDVEELSAQLRSLEGVDVDVADLLANNWQRFAGIVVLLLIGTWLYGGYKSTKEQRLMIAAERFQSIQGGFDQLRSPEDAEKKAAEKKAEEKKPEDAKVEDTQPAANADTNVLKSFQAESELLVSTERDSSYGRLAKLYEAAQAMRERNFEQTDKILADFNVAKIATTAAPVPKTGKHEDPERFVSELAAMLHARTMLAKDAGANMASVRSYLSELATNARFVNVEALILLGRLAESEENKAQVKVLSQKVIESRPELRPTVESELAQLGVSLS